MKYWLHRITGGDNALEYAHPLLFKHNYLSIGWSDLSDDSFINEVKKEGKFDKTLQKRNWELSRNRWNLWRFIHDMRKGDIVVVPTWDTFSLFELVDDVVLSNESIDTSFYIDWNNNGIKIKDGYFYNSENKQIDLGFYRKVTPILLNIPREGYADQELYSRMKIRQTNADISDLKGSIQYAKKAFEEKKPINLKEIIVEETAPKLLSFIEKLTNDYKFEDLVGWYLKSLGARIEKPSKNESPTEEGDADRVAYFDNIKTAIMVQVKKHEGTTNDWAVQQIKAYKTNHNYGDYHTQMWVISSCKEFSEKAKNEAAEADVRLINGLEFARMILDAGLYGLKL